MGHPWEEIELDIYEGHMAQENIRQLQALNRIMRAQFSAYNVQSLMILGVAGGNGLEYIRPDAYQKVYGVDINRSYLEACRVRYPGLAGILETICVDVRRDWALLPRAELLVANLFLEYVGYACFQKIIGQVRPCFVSCTIMEVEQAGSFVSDSPYAQAFARLGEIETDIAEGPLVSALEACGYVFDRKMRGETALPNGKRLLRLDFVRRAPVVEERETGGEYGTV